MLKILLDILLNLCSLFPYLDLGPISLCLSYYSLYKRLNDIGIRKNWQVKLLFEFACLISTGSTNPDLSIALQVFDMTNFICYSLKEMVKVIRTAQLQQRRPKSRKRKT